MKRTIALAFLTFTLGVIVGFAIPRHAEAAKPIPVSCKGAKCATETPTAPPTATLTPTCGTEPDYTALSPTQPSWWNPVARWCTASRPFAVTVIDRTTSPYFHKAITQAAALWTQSGRVTVTVSVQPGDCTPADGLVVVVCNFTDSTSAAGFENQTTMPPDYDLRYLWQPVVYLNDYWGAYYQTQGSQSYIDTYMAMGFVGHEIGHGLGLWHPAVPLPDGYCGTMGGGGCGPAGDYSMLATLYR